MEIGVTSKNLMKVEVVRRVYYERSPAHIVKGYATSSRVGEQPVGIQTLTGAKNRIDDLKSKVDGLDRIVSIENGIFRENNEWRDRAIVVVNNPLSGSEVMAYSDYVVFPDEYVDAAQRIGFDKVTVGTIMADAGYVQNPKDPHLSISGKSREEYLLEAVRKAVKKAESRR